MHRILSLAAGEEVRQTLYCKFAILIGIPFLKVSAVNSVDVGLIKDRMSEITSSMPLSSLVDVPIDYAMKGDLRVMTAESKKAVILKLLTVALLDRADQDARN